MRMETTRSTRCARAGGSARHGGRRRVVFWSLPALLLVVLGVIWPVGNAVAASCLIDITGAAVEGPLCCNEHKYLKLDYINSSSWDGNRAYVAKRYDGAFTETYHVYVSSGPHSYGTSGNAWRRTAIQRGGYTNMTTWVMSETQLC
jgi:hypothetical protein